MQKTFKPGDKINGYTVIDYNDETKEYEFVCDECGTKKIGYYYHLLRPCGHYIQIPELNRVFRNMLRRCYNPCVKSYLDYGGRGITVCDEWLKCPKSFEDWSLENGWSQGLQLDRIDNNSLLGYSPLNCRWVTVTENQNNKRNNVHLTVDGVTLTIAEWGRRLNVPRRNIAHYYYTHGAEQTCKRIKGGWIAKPYCPKYTIQDTTLTLTEWCEKLGWERHHFAQIKHKYGEEETIRRLTEDYTSFLKTGKVKRQLPMKITIQGITDNALGWSRRIKRGRTYVTFLIRKVGQEEAIRLIEEQWEAIKKNEQ